MNWSRQAQQELSEGKCATVRPSGHSMTGVINHRNQVIIAPIPADALEVGDAVLVRVTGQVYLHLIKAIDAPKRRVLIGNNRGRTNGWTSFDKVFGVAVEVEGKRLAAAKRVRKELLTAD